MKLTKILIFALCAMVMSSCHKEEKVIETNSRGVPMSVARYIMGDTYGIDTLYKAPDREVILIDNPDYIQYIIYTGEEVLVNSPTLRTDSLGPSIYELQDMIRTTKVNFADPRSIDRLRTVFPQYDGYETVVLGDTAQTGQTAIFGFVMSRPQQKEVLEWVEHAVSDTMAFNANVRAFGAQIERAFFGECDLPESEMPYVNSRSVLVYEVAPRYITYNDYFYGYLGGAHGIQCNRYITYLQPDDVAVTAELLFTADSDDAIRELIYEAIAADEDFMSSHRITSLSQARSYIQHNLEGEPLPIPDPALLHEGVVFSYQPYDIAPYSDGTFQIVIPYHKIAPYIAIDLQ